MQNSYSLANHTFALVANYFQVNPGLDGVNPDNYNLATNRYRLWFSGNSLVISDNLSAPLYYEHDFYRPAISFNISSNPSNLGVVTGTILVGGTGAAVSTPTDFIFLHDNIVIEISLNPANVSVFRVVTSESVLTVTFPPGHGGGHGGGGHGGGGHH